MKKIDCTVLIMSQNEEQNISKCLGSVVERFTRICVVDSFSDDGTEEIIRDYPSVELYKNCFKDWSDQRNWLVEKTNPATDLVLFLDADEEISEELYMEIKYSATSYDFAFFPVKNFFMGRHIKYAYGHPNVARLFKSDKVPLFKTDGARDYPLITGNSITFKCPLIHNDLKPLSVWWIKHIKNAYRESKFVISGSESSVASIKSTIRDKVYLKLPLQFRPIFYFIYRYFLRLGFLDGFPGFVFCFFQALSYQLMISSIVYTELKKK